MTFGWDFGDRRVVEAIGEGREIRGDNGGVEVRPREIVEQLQYQLVPYIEPIPPGEYTDLADPRHGCQIWLSDLISGYSSRWRRRDPDELLEYQLPDIGQKSHRSTSLRLNSHDADSGSRIIISIIGNKVRSNTAIAGCWKRRLGPTFRAY